MMDDVVNEIRSRITYIPNVVGYDVPYISQFARPEDVENIIRGKMATIDDPYWGLTGANSSEEYVLWARAMCGMASTAMIIGYYFKDKEVKLLDLSRDALAHGVYRNEFGTISNMQYGEFAKWIQKYNLRAEVYSRLSIRGIKLALANKKLPLVSVNPNIRGYVTSSPDRKGGHLVLITGYNSLRHVLILNNPSGFTSLKTQMRHEITEKEFRKYYAGRGIFVSPTQ